MAKSKQLILVTGATGKQGGAVLRHLLQRGFLVRALVRNPDKPEARALAGHGTEVVRGDLDDESSLRRALDGVWGVFSVQTFHEEGVAGEVRQGKALAEAARNQAVSQFVYSSVGGADRKTGIPHFDSKFEIEEHIRRTGLRHTILRPVFFMENWEGMRGMLEQGVLAQPLDPQRTLQQVSVDDIGAFAAMAFEHPGKWQGRTVELAGDELSMIQLAETFGRVLGRDVRYEQVPWDEFEKQAGHDYTVMYRWFNEAGYNADIPGLRQDYPDLSTLERWLRRKGWGPQ